MPQTMAYFLVLLGISLCAVFGIGVSTGISGMQGTWPASDNQKFSHSYGYPLAFYGHNKSRIPTPLVSYWQSKVHYTDFWTSDYGEAPMTYHTRPAPLPSALYRVDTIRDQCRCLPSDSCWPAQADWDQLNTTLYGRLIIPRPTGYPCYAGPGFDAAACEQVRQFYTKPEFVVKNAGSMQAPSFEDLGPMRCSLMASADPNAVCQAGRIPVYGVAVTAVSDVQKAISFARQRNLRIAVKSTGHDYLGRSTAPGSLLIWMQTLGSIVTQTSFLPSGCDVGQAWNGPVVTVAGAKPWSEVYQKVEDDFNSNYILGGGHCNSPGAAGGYPLGGGHSVLSPSFGLAVDNILEHQIVTVDGRLLIANACQNKDLFWALRGGGGGTFGVLVSVTYKLHKINAGYLAFSAMIISADGTGNLNPQQVEDILEVMARRAGDLDDAGWGGYFYFQPAFGFSMTFLVPADRPTAQTAMEGIMREIIDMQHRLGIILDKLNSDTDYFTHYHRFVDWRKTLDASVVTGLYNSGGRLVLGSRLIPQAAFANPRAVAQTHMAAINKNGFPLGFLGHLVNGNGVRSNPQASETSVTPAWRKSVWHSILYTAWSFNSTDDQIAQAKAALNAGTQVWRDAYPDSGAYFNEAFTDEPNWQHAFWGENYERLLKIKKVIDPDGFFVCPQCAGSELRDQSGNCAKTPSYN